MYHPLFRSLNSTQKEQKTLHMIFHPTNERVPEDNLMDIRWCFVEGEGDIYIFHLYTPIIHHLTSELIVFF